MRVAFIGDIVGRPARDIIRENLKKLKEIYSIDVVVANYENAAHGFGITRKILNELIESGIDIFTGGNHTWDKKDIFTMFDEYPTLLRPFNYPDEVVGRGVVTYKDLTVINLLGQFSMPNIENPFRIMDKISTDFSGNILIDFHAESTSEKLAMFHILKGKVSAIIGTHTHIGTDDLVIDSGTAYITDIGMTGCNSGVIGVKKEAAIYRFMTGIAKSFDIDDKCRDKILQLLIIDMDNGLATNSFKIKVKNKRASITLRADIENSIF